MNDKLIGIDLASKSDVSILYVNTRRGKSIAVQKLIDAYIKQHPNITILYSDGRIEKPIKGKYDPT